jgi:hypothetical protein
MGRLDARIGALEAIRRDRRRVAVAACAMSDAELLDVIAPEYGGPAPTDDELEAFLSWSDGAPIPAGFERSAFLATAMQASDRDAA